MADEPQRFCLGIAYMPGKDDRIAKGQDGGRDFITEAELEKAAWSFLRSGPQVNAFHMAGTEGIATVVESSIHRGPDWDLGDGIVVTKGTWLVGAILEPKAWQMALDGRANGWSPEGIARRRKVQKEGAVAIAKSALPDGDGDDFTELLDCDFPKIGLVGKGANGIPRFLVMKDADGDATGLLDPDFVRELIGKQADSEPATEETVTMTGSPAAIAKLIHGAPIRQAGDVAKAKNDTADRKRKAATGAAMPDGSYPIASESDLEKAIHAVGRGGSSHDAIRKHIISRARSLGAAGKIPDNWNSDGSLKSGVSKEAGMPDAVTKDGLGPDPEVLEPELDDGVDGLDPTVPFAAPDDLDEIPGDPADPASPAWEAIDAATATKWLSILARAQNAIGLLADREMIEVATGADPDDAGNACDLQDAQCALDYVIGQLAVFAAGEQAAADLASEAMEQVGKAAEGAAAPLDVIEGLTAVRKSGRVLSSANETHIREAAQRLNTVLSSLPQAPATDDGQPVAKSKEAAMTATATEPVAKDADGDQARDAGPVNAGGTTGLGEPRTGDQQAALPGDPPGRQVVKAALPSAVWDIGHRLIGIIDPEKIVQQVAKADATAGAGDAKTTMQAVFDEDGNLVGIVDPSDITPVTGAGAKAADDGGADDVAPAPAADDSDMTPAPPAETGTPADATADDGTVAKSSEQDVFAVLESTIAKAVAAALGEKTPAEDVAKQADVAGLLEEVETLKARLATVEEHPAAPKVFTNGAVPPANQLRGQDQGAAPVDVAKAAELKNTLYRGTAPEQRQAFDAMQEMAVARLSDIHARRGS